MSMKQPNLLMIMTDQFRYDCAGYSQIYPVHTPNIDRLAKEGAWFTEAYTPIPICSPARQCFLSGQRAEVLGGLWNYNNGSRIPGLEPSAYAWPRTWKQQGCRNGFVGKWHVHPEHGPTAYGYDDYVSEEMYTAYRASVYPQEKKQKGGFHSIDEVALEDSRTHWMSGEAIGLMNRYKQEGVPWHIRLDYSDPHPPYQPVSQFDELYSAVEIKEWSNFSDPLKHKPYIQKQQLINWRIENYTWEDWAPIVRRYYAMISQVDDAIGKVLDALDQLGEANNTIVVFTSDHGDMCGSHRMFDKHYVMYDDIVKVPLAIRWPGCIKAETRIDSFVYNMLDLPPTLLEWIGCTPPRFLQGRSLRDLLEGPPPKDWRQEVVTTYHGQQFGLFSQRMLRTREWKYVWNPTDTDELYYLSEDPEEFHNRIDDPKLLPLLSEFRIRLYEILLAEGDTLVRNSWMKDQLTNNRKL